MGWIYLFIYTFYLYHAGGNVISLLLTQWEELSIYGVTPNTCMISINLGVCVNCILINIKKKLRGTLPYEYLLLVVLQPDGSSLYASVL